MLGKEGSSGSGAGGFLTHIIYTVAIQVTLFYRMNYTKWAGRRVESYKALLLIYMQVLPGLKRVTSQLFTLLYRSAMS